MEVSMHAFPIFDCKSTVSYPNTSLLALEESIQWPHVDSKIGTVPVDEAAPANPIEESHHLSGDGSEADDAHTNLIPISPSRYALGSNLHSSNDDSDGNHDFYRHSMTSSISSLKACKAIAFIAIHFSAVKSNRQ